MNTSNEHGSSIRLAAAIVLVLDVLICGITAYSLMGFAEQFPRWFPAIFFSGVVMLIGTLAVFIVQLVRATEPIAFGQSRMSHAVWALAVTSVLCTSSVHKFYPFRPGIVEWWPLIPDSHPVMARLLQFNYLLTLAALVLTVLLWAAYGLGRRGSASIGAVVLAGVLLLPNDSCPNPFNAIWLEWIGGSPAMFVPTSIALCLGVCALTGIWPLRSIFLMAVICAATLLLGLGHLTETVW